METNNINIRLEDWVNGRLARGKVAFSLPDLKDSFISHSDIAIKRSLNRLSAKGRILSIHKGYYLIIAPQYTSRGILPPSVYLNDLMKFLERPYYVGLLNAAVFYGAAHQQPQESFVFTTYPVLRPTKKKGIKVNYISKKEIHDEFLEKRKTETGYLKISSPELTATDLLQFEKRVGGLNRVGTVLNELADEINPEKLDSAFLNDIPITTVQRLGYLLDKELGRESLADKLYDESRKAGLIFYRIPLKASGVTKGCSSDERWKIVVNTKIEID